ncbi:MAG: M20/M25/M40 family metallo-hydrolase [Bacteroidales bacterium]|nr:M20/M25/M40 family metallo-hydrolase [Bacteroidales bacterium]
MRKIFTLMLWFAALLLMPFSLLSNSLVLIPVSDVIQSRSYIENPAFEVHFYSDDFVIATVDFVPKEPHTLLDSNPWQADISYYIVYASADEAVDYQQRWSDRIQLLYKTDNLLIVSTNEKQYGQLEPARNDGMIRIHPQQARIPEASLITPSRTADPDPFIQELIDQVDYVNITATVQHLQDYGTRDSYHPQSVEAQNWIKAKYESYGLEVELMDFPMPGGPASDNVIALMIGTKYPDEYVVCGAHYDSYSYSGLAPGADDNASGTAGVLEMARILTQYSFDRSIIFCSFSGEEYGLYGSAAYAAYAAQQGLDIHGYFNLDMNGYLKPGNTTIKSTLIFPSSAQELADFYMSVCSTYLPEFVVEPGTLSGGDSDHTSFNNNGYMGIYPFEAVPDYSPYIHTSNDIIGLSYNNEQQAAIFTKAALASIVTMANRLLPPRGLVALAGDQQVEMEWLNMPDAASYNIYRDEQLVDNVTSAYYLDLNVENGTPYTYFVTAIYADSGLESDPSNSVTVVPMPPLVLPFSMDFENGTPYWEFTGSWGLTTTQSYSPIHSLSESPNGNYQNNTTSYAYFRPFSLNMGFTEAELSFWTRYDIENNYDYMYLEVSTNGMTWAQLASFTGTQNNWQKKTYNLNAYLGQNWVQLRFRFVSDYMVTKDGMYIDDFTLQTTGGMMTFNASLEKGWNSLSSFIQPAETGLDQLFEPVSDKLIAVQSATGLYDPAHGINTIGSWNGFEGYKVKMDAAANLMISGPEAMEGSLDIHTGWNLIPVLSSCPVALTGLIDSYADQIIFVRNLSGTQVYWPEAGLESLIQLSPGKAYMLKSASDLTLHFPECTSAKAQLSEPEIAITSAAHNLGFAAGVLSFAQPGDQIIAFTDEGLPAGILLIDDPAEPAFMAVFGNDSLSVPIDGFVPGQSLQLKWRKQDTGYYHDLTAEYDSSMPDQEVFQYDGISLINALEPDMVGLSESAAGIELYPNPVSDYLTINANGQLIQTIDLLRLDGKLIQRFKPDHSQAELDVSGLVTGMYVVRIQTSSGIRRIPFIKE